MYCMGITVHVLLHGGIDNQLLGDTVTSQLPDELVLPANFLVGILAFEDVVLVDSQFGMVVLDELRDTLHDA